MRSSKYHDYSVLKVALFIILVILGLIIYCQYIVPSLEHKPGEIKEEIITPSTCIEKGVKEVITYCSECGEVMSRDRVDVEFSGCVAGGYQKENINDSTCTQTGSYDNVKYCVVCDEELSREEVTIAKKAHTPGEAVVEDVNPETHTNTGYYYNVKYCTECGTQTSKNKVTVSAAGHSYEWELEYNSEKGEFTMVGTCDCTETGNVKRITSGLTITIDNSTPTCCRKVMIGTVVINGETITRTVEIEPDPHAFAEPGIDLDGEIVTIYLPVSNFAKWDDDYGVYYDHDGERFVLLNLEGNDWDENGFALGAFKCGRCENEVCIECHGDYWYIVLIYNPKYDTRLAK